MAKIYHIDKKEVLNIDEIDFKNEEDIKKLQDCKIAYIDGNILKRLNKKQLSIQTNIEKLFINCHSAEIPAKIFSKMFANVSEIKIGSWNNYKIVDSIHWQTFYMNKDGFIETISLTDFGKSILVYVNPELTGSYTFWHDVINIKAFKDSNLNEIYCPAATLAYSDAFNGCKAKKIELPKVKFLGNGLFQNCKKLEILKLNSVSFISFNTFDGCDSLKELFLPNDTEVTCSLEGLTVYSDKKIISRRDDEISVIKPNLDEIISINTVTKANELLKEYKDFIR